MEPQAGQPTEAFGLKKLLFCIVKPVNTHEES